MRGPRRMPNPEPALEVNWRLVRSTSTRLRAGCLDAFTYASVTAYLAQYPGRQVAVALEQKRGALLYNLMKYQQVVLYPIHGATASNFRTALYPSGSKDDHKDADLLLDLLIQHRAHIRRLDPDTEETRKLQLLVEAVGPQAAAAQASPGEARIKIDERTRQSNRLTDELKIYFPQALRWFPDALTHASVCN